jgi:hypothetical protein
MPPLPGIAPDRPSPAVARRSPALGRDRTRGLRHAGKAARGRVGAARTPREAIARTFTGRSGEQARRTPPVAVPEQDLWFLGDGRERPGGVAPAFGNG